MGKLPSHWLEKFGNKYFGIQTIFGLELLSMSKPLTVDEYYASKGEVSFGGSWKSSGVNGYNSYTS